MNPTHPPSEAGIMHPIFMLVQSLRGSRRAQEEAGHDPFISDLLIESSCAKRGTQVMHER